MSSPFRRRMFRGEPPQRRRDCRPQHLQGLQPPPSSPAPRRTTPGGDIGALWQTTTPVPPPVRNGRLGKASQAEAWEARRVRRGKPHPHLPPYPHGVARCPKCHNVGFVDTYVIGGFCIHGSRGEHALVDLTETTDTEGLDLAYEYVHHTCVRCGYGFDTDCADAEGTEQAATQTPQQA